MGQWSFLTLQSLSEPLAQHTWARRDDPTYSSYSSEAKIAVDEERRFFRNALS